jgi:CRISPR/Cas system-associated endonuclease Cas1
MKKLQNTLYVTSQDSYLALDGENVVVLEDEKELGRLPLHNLEGIVSFGYRGASPALMGGMCEKGCIPVLSDTTGKLPCPRNWKSQRKCTAAENTVCCFAK